MIHAAFTLAVFLTGCSVGAAAGLESWRALDVQIETLAEPIQVNGLPLVIHRAVGKGVAQLAESMNRQWIQEAGVRGVRSDEQGNWVVRSRIHNGSLEVLQWRGEGVDAEALWSSSNLRARARIPPQAELQLPIGCVAGRTVHGKVDTATYLQRTARCTASPRATLASLSAVASRKGYAVQSRDGLLVARGKVFEVTVIAWDRVRSSGPEGASLVYMQVQRKGSAP